jgi:uncharacterized protein (TIGR00251 family)
VNSIRGGVNANRTPKDIRKRGRDRIGIRLRIQPSAPRSVLVGWNSSGELRVKVNAKPAGGAANKELVSFLAKRFHLRKGDILLESGKTSRKKILSVPAFIKGELEKLPDI